MSPTRSRRRPQQLGQQIRLLVAGMFVVTGATAAWLTQDVTMVTNPAAVWALIALGLAFGVAIAFLPWDRMHAWQSGVTGLAVVALLGALTLLTGGSRSPLYYFLPIVPVAGAILFTYRWMVGVTLATVAACLLPAAVSGDWGSAHYLHSVVIILLAAVAFTLVRELRQLYRQQRFLLAAADIAQLEIGTDVDAFLNVALQQMVDSTGIAFAAVARTRSDGSLVWAAATENRTDCVVNAEELVGAAISPADWFVGQAGRTAKPQVSGDLFADPRFATHPLPGHRPQLAPQTSALAMPLLLRSQIIGVLYLVQDRPDAFVRQHVALAQLVSGHLAVALDSRQLLDRASREARVDALTGAYNRRFLEERLVDLARSARALERPLSLIFCDIRFFKQFNERYGHLTGDWVLRGLTETLKSAVRTGDVVTRYGGDEFVIVLPDTPAESAEAICQRVQMRIAEWNKQHLGRSLPAPVEVTLGVHTAIGPEADELIHAADMAMFAARTADAR